MTRPKQGVSKPEPRPGESEGAYRVRTAGWDVMADIAAEMKTVSSRTESAVRKVDALRRAGHVWRVDGTMPASQVVRVAAWHAALASALETLQAFDYDAWRAEVAAEVDQVGEGSR
ncbi:hypothetical protein OHA25_60655 (plasmid) [Nonomuraea sp. NBC_00507]|uniref:hypothetical protein n=1 Tax=Nonomuraea sp. NBC_00507 TaxID=2976002 RepID=UPI002E191175